MGDSIHEELVETAEDDDDSHLGDTGGGRGDSHFVNVLNTIISSTARLNVLLPTATILAFTNFTPLITNDGHCDTLDSCIFGFFLFLSTIYCVFFSLTDSFRTAKGKVYYGLATFSGIMPLNGEQRKPSAPSDYRLRWADLFHALLSLIAFLAFAASQKDVVECYHPEIPTKIITTVPLLVESVIGALFVMFPSRRRGIGYPFLLQKDALGSNN